MHLSTRLLSRLDLRPGEERLTFLLTALSFCQGWALVLADTAAMALFLSALGPAALPGIYIGAAVVVPLAGAAFGWLSQRLATERLAFGSLLALMVLLLLLWIGSALGNWAFFLLLLWYRIFNALSGVIFWGLAGRLLHLRQAKRLYGVVSSGENVSRVLGYALVPLLVGLLGVANLLALACIGLAGALVSIWALGRVAARINVTQAALSAQHQVSAGGMKALLANPYTLFILALIALSNWAFSTLDLTFAGQAHLQFADAKALASFLAGFSLLLSILRLVGRPLLTGRLIGRYGVAFGLMAQPVVLSLGALLLIGVASSGPLLIFWMVVVMRLTDSATSTILSRPALQILFQPLPAAQRLAAQSTADGIVAPLALGAVGLTGLLLGNAEAPVLAFILLGLGILWALVARRVGRSYLSALGQRLSRRVGPGAVDLADPAALALVRRALASPHSGEVLYAIELLSERMPLALEQARPALLAHADPHVRRATLELISAGRLPADTGELTAMLGSEDDLFTRAAAIRAFCAAAEAEAIDTVAFLIDDPAPEICRSTLVGLLRHGGIAGILAVGRRLLELTQSPNPADRILAATIAGELRSADYFQPLRGLFHDPDPAVRRAVLLAAGQIGSTRMLPHQIAALSDRSTARAAATSLERAGPIAVPDLVVVFAHSALPEQIRIATVLGWIGGDLAIGTLRGAIDHPDPELRRAACAGLVTCGYRTFGPERLRIRTQIRSEAEQATCLLAAITDLKSTQSTLLIEALAADVEHCRERILHLLAISTDAQSIAAARANLAQGTSERRAYAVEIIDVLLAPELKPAVLPLFDDIAPSVVLQRLRTLFPQPALSRADRLAQLIRAPTMAMSSWTQRAAMHAALTEAVAIDPPPLHMQETLAVVGRVAALRNVQLFAATPKEALAEIADLLIEETYAERAPIFAQGDVGNALFIVVSGSVRIYAHQQPLNLVCAGEVFGEMSVLDPAPRSASAEAAELTVLLRLERGDLDTLFDMHPEVVRSLIRTLTRNLRNNLHVLRTLRVQVDTARLERGPLALVDA